MASEHVQHCRQCEYDLTGLPTRGRCPECGGTYNLKTGQGVTGGPSESHRRGDRIMARIRTILLLLAIVVVMGCGGLLSWIVHQLNGKWLQPLALAGLLGVVLLMAAVLSYLNEKEI